jgi:alcohol dehydrogenase
LNQPVVGRSRDGGYAEMMLARSTGLVAIPDELSSEEAAPILCAGIATFNALKKCGAQAGDVVAILGIGGLGHLAVQYARRMGFKVVAVGRGQDIVQDVMNLGAHVYVDTSQQDTGEALKRLGGAAAVVTTISNPAAVASALAGLAPKGRLVVLGAGKDELAVPAGFLVGGERRVMGSITGTPYENERALQFSVLAEVHPRIELMALEEANEAYQRMKSGKAKFRMVLTVAADS